MLGDAKIEVAELRKNAIIKSWLSGMGAKPNTRSIYIDSMRVYTTLLNKTPEQILKESEEDIISGKLMRERKIFHELREFREFLESSGRAPMTIKGRLTGVRSFFTFYNIQLPILPRSATKARPLLKNREIPTREDIQKILKIADPLEKAIVLTGVSSGLSVNEIVNLKISSFINGYDKETGITTLHLIRAKVGYEHYTFLSPEASKAVIDYIEFRHRTSDRKDKVGQDRLLKQRIEYDKIGNPVGYLFICRYVPPEYLITENKQDAEELRKLSTRAVQKIYRELSEKARKHTPKNEWSLLRSHNIRKFFNNTLLANHAELFFTDFLMGHQIDATRDAYFRADPKALREEYQKYIPYLTIQKELNISESPEFQKLKSENELLAREAVRATVERHELQKLRDDMEKIKELEKDLPELIRVLMSDPEAVELMKKMK